MDEQLYSGGGKHYHKAAFVVAFIPKRSRGPVACSGGPLEQADGQ